MLLSPEGCTFDHRSQPVKHTERLREPTSEGENSQRHIAPARWGKWGVAERDGEKRTEKETETQRQALTDRLKRSEVLSRC